jgi:TolB protein
VVCFGLIIGYDTSVSFAQSAASNGTIALIGDDFNVYTADPKSETITQLTFDASSTRHYQYPTWSTDGRLAYFCCDSAASRQVVTEVYTTEDILQPGDLIYEGRSEVFTYAYWSPANCDDVQAGCRYLAVLLGGDPDGFKVELIADGTDSDSSLTIGTGAPFYFSWKPDGTRMVWQRNNQRLDVYEVADDRISSDLDVIPGLFPAPMWSPVDDRLLVATLNTDNMRTHLTVLEDTDELRLQSDIDGLVAFSWSPDGTQVAYRTITRSGYSGVTVVDASTGEEIAQSNGENVIAFFWSPDSTKLAYVIAERRAGTFDANYSRALAQQEDIQLVWLVLDVASDDTTRYISFSPTREMLYVLSFFDQFAQSHRVWSPDSAAIVYSETLRGGRSSVSILDITSRDAVPFSLADGVLGIWSYHTD